MDWHIVYAKFDGCKGFRAFDVNEGRQVGNLIYASLMENTEDTRQKLQKLADLNKEYHLAETTEAGRLEQGVSPCAATSQERQGVLPDKVKGNGQTNHLPTISKHYGKAKDRKRRVQKALGKT